VIVKAGDQTIDQYDLVGGSSSGRLAEPGRSRDVCVAQPLPGKISALLSRRARASKYPRWI
jgi:hypothetical protein